MNYIKQLNKVFQNFYGDSRLQGQHISLYMAIFFYWNLYRFPKYLPINRSELMKMAKLGSKSTYHRLIKNLSEWGYIKYLPSKNPHQKSAVKMSHYRTLKNTDMAQLGTLLKRYHPNNVPVTIYIKQIQTNNETLKPSPNEESEVIHFFKSKKWPLQEAQKFFNHYQSIGWKIAGKIPIVDWTATAENWMLKARELQEEKSNRRGRESSLQNFDNQDFLKVGKEKNYNEPL